VRSSIAGASCITGKASGEFWTIATLLQKWWYKSSPRPRSALGDGRVGRSMARGPGVGSESPPSARVPAVLPPPGSHLYRHDSAWIPSLGAPGGTNVKDSRPPKLDRVLLSEVGQFEDACELNSVLVA
jgi:hypothetical protein